MNNKLKIVSSFIIASAIFWIIWAFEPINFLVSNIFFSLGDTVGFIIVFILTILMGELPLLFLTMPRRKKIILMCIYPFLQFIIFIAIMAYYFFREFN
jgi:hypothetical protein